MDNQLSPGYDPQFLFCSGCRGNFQSPSAFVNHLNNNEQCTLPNPENIPIPPAFYQRPGEEIYGRYHPNSGYLYGRGATMLDNIKTDEHERRREHVIYYPFKDKREWELGKFLAKKLTQTDINEFLNLSWFEGREKPVFKSANELLGWIDRLPSGPTWNTTMVDFPVPTVRPIQLIWRDAQEVVADILCNPIFANYTTFDPHVVMRGMEREYSEFFTANRAHHIQDQLPQGASIVPIIVASDKTPVTGHTGGLEMHPVFVSIGNIQSDVRMQATSHAWRCVAFIPVPNFNIHPDFQTLCSARLFHQCMDVVFKSLKATAKHGTAMTDPLGYIRNCYTPLVAYIADLPEQQLVACVSRNASPVTVATLPQFGDPEPHESRTGRATLEQIKDLCDEVNPWDIVNFQKKAKLIKLLGVHLPFWRDWRFADPAYFLVGEILHSCHKFFFDHVLIWCKEVAGKHLLDTRYKTQHRRVGIRHFHSGVSHVKQMTGREHRDIQRTIVPMIAKATPTVTPLFVYCIRSIIEFIYKAQNPVHSDDSIASMVEALQEFHATRHAITEAEARRGASGVKSDFNIPKLELLQSFARNIKDNGSLIQYSADVSERLLITHCKNPFERTSRQAGTFTQQVAAILNREESIRRFDLYHILRLSQVPIDHAIITEDQEVTTIDPTLSFISHVLPEEEHTFKGPRPFRNHFSNPKGFMSSNGAIAFHVTVKPDRTGLPIPEMERVYGLLDVVQHINTYINNVSGGGMLNVQRRPSIWKVNLWHKFRIQHHSSFRSRYLLKSQEIQVYPRSPERPFGTYDVVLLSRPNTDGILDVARVKSVFAPLAKPQYEATHLPAVPLIYIEYFSVLQRPEEDQEGVGLYKVQRLATQAGLSPVVLLTEVVHAVELIPVFETKIPGIEVTSETCLDAYEQYYVNTFADKETYNVFRSFENQ